MHIFIEMILEETILKLEKTTTSFITEQKLMLKLVSEVKF